MTVSLASCGDRLQLTRDFQRVRAVTEDLVRPLAVEDMVVQSMPDVSPTKWHLAHTSWFFERLVLERSAPGYRPFNQRFNELFNSYYQSLGDPYPRERRGLLSRPTVDEIMAYRGHVDAALVQLLESGSQHAIRQLAPTLAVGLHHEQQHQELLLMDVKHVLSLNAEPPVYRQPRGRSAAGPAAPLSWCAFEGGAIQAGCGKGGFAYDNERPRHAQHLRPFELASRPINAGEYLAFMRDGGYERPELWLSDGWALAQREGWRAPLYWESEGQDWTLLTLGGRRAVDPREPVCHVSYYEADAYASWSGARLPSEFEWEHAAAGQPQDGTFLESAALHPRALSGGTSATREARPVQLLGDVWEWTASPYAPYPGYEPFAGPLGEYNGKFMINQLVLRGGSCITPRDHIRATYRNFYYPQQRWMFAGFRLAR